MSPDAPTLSCRAVFISDVHLGTRGCQAEMLLDFIRHLDCEPAAKSCAPPSRFFV
jgi:DNA polymerase II small subunit/DNA polymerase delta subunit B